MLFKNGNKTGKVPTPTYIYQIIFINYTKKIHKHSKQYKILQSCIYLY